MGAPKQKWTAEEEAALKAGIAKHGPSKWSAILKDPEFSAILSLRSNVDLKDKWRNMNVTANGCGREKARVVMKKSQPAVRHDDNPMAFAIVTDEFDDAIVEAKPLAVSSEPLQISTCSQRSVSTLENLILEAIINLKEPTGSNKTAIAMYIEDQYESPPNFKRWLSLKLKELTASGKLIKVKRDYRIAPSSAFSEGRGSKAPCIEGGQRDLYKVDKKDFKPLTQSLVDTELQQMRNMTPDEAAAVVARFVAEAEIYQAEAEEAAREAEAAEADAEAACAFAEAAMLTIQKRNTAKLYLLQMVRV